MPPMSMTVAVIVAMAITYFVCGIPFGLIVASRMGGIDVRKVGSGNIGTTNVARSVGAGAAGVTFLLDVAKGVVCTLVARMVFARLFAQGDLSAMAPSQELGFMVSWVYLATIVGHVFSCYLGFHGGKGIAVGLGGALGFIPVAGLLALACFIAVVAATRYVSAGSITAAIVLPIWTLVFYHPRLWALVPILIVSCIVVWAHRGNIKKLMAGNENKLSFHKKGDVA